MNGQSVSQSTNAANDASPKPQDDGVTVIPTTSGTETSSNYSLAGRNPYLMSVPASGTYMTQPPTNPTAYYTNTAFYPSHSTAVYENTGYINSSENNTLETERTEENNHDRNENDSVLSDNLPPPPSFDEVSQNPNIYASYI